MMFRQYEIRGKCGLRVAGETGLEPATFGVTSRCSSQLRYSPAEIRHQAPPAVVALPELRQGEQAAGGMT